MIRASVLIAALALGLAASPPPSSSFLVATAPMPTSPVSGTTKFSAAPLPNVDLAAPARGGAQTVSLEPSIFSPRNTYRGEGFVWGSTAQTEQEKRLKPAPGVNLSVPLQ